MGRKGRTIEAVINCKVRFGISINQFRRILKLLREDDYSAYPYEKEIVQILKKIGYVDEITTYTQFRRMHLPIIWSTIFNCVTKGMTNKVGWWDQASKTILQVLCATKEKIKVDYVALIWKDLINIIKKKEDLPTIRYPRVLSTLIMDTLDRLKETVDGDTFEMQKWA
jgi:ribosomal protein S8